MDNTDSSVGSESMITFWLAKADCRGSLSKVVLPTTSLRVGLNFDTPKKSIDGVKLGLLWPDLQKLARISPVPNTAGSEFVITSAKTLDVGLKEDGFKALFALLRWDWPEFYDPEKLFDICASKITGEDHMSRVTSDAQQALRECFSRILQVHKGLLLCTTTAHNFQVSVRHGATKRADIPQRPPRRLNRRTYPHILRVC